MIRHPWDISPRQAIQLQKELAGEVTLSPLKEPIHTVAGVDCAFVVGGRSIITAAVLCDAKTWKPIAVASDRRKCSFPYVPGLLSFREAPSILAAIERLPERPDIVMCDGQGLAHPRRFGIACHVGLWLDIPTMGVAKSRLCGRHRALGLRRGCCVKLRDDSSVIGAVLQTQDGVKPLYVSPGHMITLEDAIAWTLKAANAVRLPQPTRLAHQHVSHLKARG